MDSCFTITNIGSRLSSRSRSPSSFLSAWPLAKANQHWRAFVVLVGGLALVHYAAYSLLNLPPYHWYYGILIGALALIGAGGLVELAGDFRIVSLWRFGRA